MRDLTGILGQKKIINEIVTAFEQKKETATICLLIGNSGTGKSHIAKTVADKWTEIANERRTVVLEGDLSQSERAYYPFNAGLDQAKGHLQEKSASKQSLTELAKGIPIAGDFLGMLVSNLASDQVIKQKHLFSILTDDEYDILLALNNFYKEADVLFIADNFHYWDESSIKFLDLLCSGRFNQTLPFLKRIRVLILYASDQTDNANKHLKLFFDNNKHHVFSTKSIDKSAFAKVLTAFGAPQLQTDKIDLLFSITNGHLEIVKKLSDTLQKVHAADASLMFKNEIFPVSRQDLLEKIFILRLQQLGADGHQIISLLEYASIIGLHFQFEEIVCLTQYKKEETLQIIERAKELHFVNATDSHSSFSHEVIREFFLCRIENKKSTYYKKFAECLGVLRPAEYFTRANLLFESGQVAESMTLYVIGHLKSLRDGTAMPSLVRSRISNLAGQYNLDGFIDNLSVAYQHFHEGKYDIAKRLLKELEDIYPQSLLAEKYYLLSLCLPKNLDRQDLIESRNCLLNWDALKVNESEIWIRLMLTLISRHAHLNDYEEAAVVERKIMMLLSERAAFDPAAAYNLNVLRRKASILHISEIAKKRTELAIGYFKGKLDGGVYLYPIQYYMALINHSGNLISSGDFETAYFFSQQAFVLRDQTPEIIFPRPEVATNNFILAAYLSSHLSAGKCVELYELLFSRIDKSEERILIQTNYIIFKALDNKVDDAYRLLEKLWSYLQTGTREDFYYNYYVQINRFALHFLTDRKEQAAQIMASCRKQIPSTPDKQFLKRRHDLLEETYLESLSLNPEEWNKYLFKKYPAELGVSWAFFGHAFLFTDMQFWSDS